MARTDRLRRIIRRTAPLIALVGALALGGCYDDGYDGYGAYGGGGYYGSDYGYAGFYDGWPGYGWYDGFYYPGSGYYVYDRHGGRRHWNGPGGRGWQGQHGAWNGNHGNWNGGQGWAGRRGGDGGQGWSGRRGGDGGTAAPQGRQGSGGGRGQMQPGERSDRR